MDIMPGATIPGAINLTLVLIFAVPKRQTTNEIENNTI